MLGPMTATDRPERPIQGPPHEVAEYATRTVDYVQRALGVALEYDSDTLPLLDHYPVSYTHLTLPTN